MIKGKIIFLCTLVTFGMISGISHATNEDSSFLLDNVDCTKEGNISSISSFNEDKKDHPIIIDDGGNVSYAKCLNCGKLNTCQGAMPQDKICSYCGLPINTKPVIYEYRKCVNCRTSNKVLKSAPSSTLCTFCEDPIGSEVYRCINCHSLADSSKKGIKSAICSNCNCWLNIKVYKCAHCETVGLIENTDDYEKYCNKCDDEIYTYNYCLHCNRKLRVYYNYNNEEEIFYHEEKPYRNGFKCPYCFSTFNKSNLYTAIQAKFSYTFEGETAPLFGCKVVLNDHGYFHHEAVCNEDGIARFRILNKEFNSVSERMYMSIWPTDDLEDIVIVNSEGTPYMKTDIWSGETCNNPEFEVGSINSIVFKAFDAEKEKEFYIGQAAMCARNYARDMMSKRAQPISPEPVTIVYPSYDNHFSTFTSGAFYRFSEKKIHLWSKWEISSETIMHEYGHHIQHQEEVDTIDSPSFSGDHYSQENHIGRKYGDGLFDYLDETEGKKLAWAEAWPNVFVLIAKDYAQSCGIDTTLFTSYNYEDNSSEGGYYVNHDTGKVDDKQPSSESGEGCELTIMQILWDLYDDFDSPYYHDVDYIAFGYQAWFDLTTVSKTYTLKDFCTLVVREYPYLKTNVITLLSQHGISMSL